MIRTLSSIAAAAALLAGCSSTPTSHAPPSLIGNLAHAVAFELADESDADELVADCRRLLSDIPGVVMLTVGERGPEFDRALNDQVFDVLLFVVFEDRGAHDAYQVHPDHRELVGTWEPRLAGVRVLDAWIE